MTLHDFTTDRRIKKPTFKMEFRLYNIDYAETFAHIRNNPNILNNGYDKTPNPFTKQDAIDFINIQLRKKPPQRFLIFHNNELAGEIGITIQDDVHRLCAEIGYFIAEPFWGKGLATEAIRKMTEYTFATFDIVRIIAGVFDFNKASMKALQRNGYHLESIRKKSVIKNRLIIDDYIWVKLKS
jgi:ribosomal-protein-alanine N-acetyltransferase